MTRWAKMVVAIVAVMLVASMGDFTRPATAQQSTPDPAPALLASFNLPGTPPFVTLLEDAADRLAGRQACEKWRPCERSLPQARRRFQPASR